MNWFSKLLSVISCVLDLIEIMLSFAYGLLAIGLCWVSGCNELNGRSYPYHATAYCIYIIEFLVCHRIIFEWIFECLSVIYIRSIHNYLLLCLCTINKCVPKLFTQLLPPFEKTTHERYRLYGPMTSSL